MKTVTEMKDRLAGAARVQASRYARGEQRPLAGYAAVMTVYAGAIAAVAAAVSAQGKPVPDGLSAGDLVLCAASTHKLSRLIAKDPVTSPLRAPFAAYKGAQRPAELDEDVRGEGGQKTVGELLTCPFCISTWVATGFTQACSCCPALAWRWAR